MPNAGHDRGSRWCFTLNNYTADDINRLLELESSGKVSYLVCGKEVGQEGTRHLQGFCITKRSFRLNGIKALLGSNGVHCERAQGTNQQASEYCKKEGDFFEFGSFPRGPGSRTDLETIGAELVRGDSVTSVAERHPGAYLRLHRGFRALSNLFAPDRNHRTQYVWAYGTTRTGKSSWIHEESQRLTGGSVYWCANASLTWLDGYEQHKGVVLDDYNGEIPIALLLKFLDRYPLRLPVKGDHVKFNARIVWISSQYHPEHFYGRLGDQYDALLERIDEIHNFDDPECPFRIQNRRVDFIPYRRERD